MGKPLFYILPVNLTVFKIMREITEKAEKYSEKDSLLELLDSGQVLTPSELILYANILRTDTTSIKEPASEFFILSDKLTEIYESIYEGDLKKAMPWEEINSTKLLGVAEELLNKRENELGWYYSIYGEAGENRVLPMHAASLEKTRKIVSGVFNSLSGSKYERRYS
jgi:hypothetical protein